MCIMKYPGEQSVPLTYFPAEVPQFFGSVCLGSLDYMITCEPPTGTRGKDWGHWLSQSWRLYPGSWEWIQIPWNDMYQAGTLGSSLSLFFTFHVYIGEIMPFVLYISNILDLADCIPGCYLTCSPVPWLHLLSWWWGGRRKHMVAQVPQTLTVFTEV